ncbi:MAG: terpene cyclase/mutase family protein [Planctomycetes bacterium]|nr:terpene cyclase/mutase family protein [Planctomycetota bacterium]
MVTIAACAAEIVLFQSANFAAAQNAREQLALAENRAAREKPQSPKQAGRVEGAERFQEIDLDVLRAVDRGLKWLSDTQQTNGSWKATVGFKLNNSFQYDDEVRDRGDVGVTALCAIAFLANGQAPGRGKYGKVVDRALEYVLSCQQSNGYFTVNGSRMYSHAFSTLFLAELMGMVKRDDVREKLEDAVRLIVDSQNREGGWRYVPFAPESDMSITVCQVMALRAARNVGIPVPRATIDRAVQYVKDSSNRDIQGFGMDDERGAFRYQKINYSRATFPLTAAGIVALNGAGIYSDRDIELGIDYLERQLVSFTQSYGDSYMDSQRGHYFFYYGHYYAVQAMYTASGTHWDHYWKYIKDVLIKMQMKDGSWPNNVGPGEAFSTATATLILEIPFRYLPIFQR